MGIKSLHSFLRKKCPEAYKTISLNEYAYEKISIDVTLFLFKYKAAVGSRWLHAFINLIVCLRRNNVHCFFVFDGPSPKEKDEEKKRRKSDKEKIQDRANEIDFALGKYNTTGEIMDILLETMKRRKSPPKLKRLLSKRDEPVIDVKWLEKYLERIRGQVIHISEEDLTKVKTLFDYLGIPYGISLCEAETLCAKLAEKGIVKAALSEDTDLLPCGAPLFLHKINTHDDTCQVLDIEKILIYLELTFEQFRDLCILCGTDYNSNIPRIGPHGAYKLIQEHGTLENFPDNIDTSSLNYIRVREIFSDYPGNLPIVEFCHEPDWEKLSSHLFKINCHNLYSSIQTAMRPQIVFS